MTVFKAYFNIAKRNLGAVSLYLGIMLLMTVLITTNIPADMSDLKVSTDDYRIAIHNEDLNDPISQALVENLSARSLVREVGSSERDIKDALFWREVDYILRIPSGFGAALLKGEPIKVETVSSPNDYTHMYIDSFVNAYMGTLQAYHQADKGLSLQQMLDQTAKDLSSQTQILSAQTSTEPYWMRGLSYYFKYLSYSLLAALSTGMGYVLTEMLKRENVLRVRAAFMSETRYNLLIALSSLVYGLLVLLVLLAGGFILMKAPLSALAEPKLQMLLLAALLYMFMAMAITLLVTAFTHNKNVLSGVTNVISLGSSFLGGVFVPVQFLGEGVTNISKFIPAYWYTVAVDGLIEATQINAAVTAGYWKALGILALMASVVLVSTLLVNKYKRQRGI